MVGGNVENMPPRIRTGHRVVDTHDLRDMIGVFMLALSLRLLFTLVTADRYDPDEFVFLALGRAIARGAVPYRDFPFFHPPGMLLLLRLLDPALALWWPLARGISLIADSITAVLVWQIGTRLYGRRAGGTAAVLYSISPIALITGGRVELEPLMTLVGMGGLALLLSGGTKRSFLAGICLGLACWIKYPALLFLPVYLLAQPRRALLCLTGFFTALLLLFAPFLPDIHAVYRYTVTWQLFHRIPNSRIWELQKILVLWLVMNFPAFVALLVRRSLKPYWLVGGFLAGAFYFLTAQVYYHYYLPMVPFAALLAAPLVARWISLTSPTALLTAVALTLAWATDVNRNGPGRGFVTATSLSILEPTLQVIRRQTAPSDSILADRYEYAYLTGRRSVPYFWNVVDVVDDRHLRRLAQQANIVIVSNNAGGYSYPPSFITYADKHFQRQLTPAAIVWLVRPDRAATNLRLAQANR